MGEIQRLVKYRYLQWARFVPYYGNYVGMCTLLNTLHSVNTDIVDTCFHRLRISVHLSSAVNPAWNRAVWVGRNCFWGFIEGSPTLKLRFWRIRFENKGQSDKKCVRSFFLNNLIIKFVLLFRIWCQNHFRYGLLDNCREYFTK